MIINKYPKLSVKHVIKEFAAVAFFNLIIAFLLWTLMSEKDTFLMFFVLSQCIGLSICSFGNILFNIFKPSTTLKQVLLLIICLMAGSMTGLVLFSVIFNAKHDFYFPVLIAGIIFGTVISYFFVVHEKYSQLKLEKKEEELKRISLEKENIQANLKYLQAQIEPHFLFNTLSNVLSLLDTDIEKGKKMLENLTLYLRTSLKHTRNDQNNLSQEIETIRSYLDINKIRMDDRLEFNIELPKHLQNIPIPPMLIQPIVENAVKHGIEPKVSGGSINISISEKESVIEIKITDTGVGINSELSSQLGIDNVKKRIQALFGTKGYVIFEDNKPSGLIVVIGVPYEASDSHNS